MSIRLLTFDLDDTLWDAAPVLRRAEAAQHRWLQAHRPAALAGLDEDALATLKKQVWRAQRRAAHDVGALRRALLDELQRRAGYSAAETAAGTAQAFAVFLKERQRIDVHPVALPVLRHLAQRYRLCALSNGNSDVYRTAAGPCFEFAFNAAEVGAGKPAPALFRAALEATGASAAHSVHIGDHPEHDIAGAQRMGMRSVWMNHRGRRWREVAAQGQQPADAEISCLSELPAALEGLEEHAPAGGHPPQEQAAR